MLPKIILALILATLIATSVLAMTLTINQGPTEIRIKNWDALYCDGNEIKILVSHGEISISPKLIIE